MGTAIIGPGAMGLLYGGKLSAEAEVTLVCRSAERAREIEAHGVTIVHGGEEKTYRVKAAGPGEEKEAADLVILFTKAYAAREALEQNRALIGPDTVLLSLQNGAGHEETLRAFTDEGHILIGTTMQGSRRLNPWTVENTGLGDTNIGALVQPFDGIERIRDLFERSGFPCAVHKDIRQVVWKKLVVNASSSALSAVLNTRQGFVAEDANAWAVCEDLVREICAAAAGAGVRLDPKEEAERVKNNLIGAPQGIPSILADLRSGRQTEVDFISGAVVASAAKSGIPVPRMEQVVRLIHAMEKRGESAC